MNWLKTIAAASTVAIIGSVASASTVINGSFEDIGDGVLNGSGWQIFPDVPGWNGAPTIEIQSEPTLGFKAQEGDYYAELDTNRNSRIFQNVVLDAGTYVLSFFYSPRVNQTPTDTNDLGYSVSTGDDLVSEIIAGAPNDDYPHGIWTEVKAYFTLERSETVELSFEALGAESGDNCGSCGALIDDISLAAVPLPAGVLLMLSALGAFGFARRRTQA